MRYSGKHPNMHIIDTMDAIRPIMSRLSMLAPFGEHGIHLKVFLFHPAIASTPSACALAVHQRASSNAVIKAHHQESASIQLCAAQRPPGGDDSEGNEVSVAAPQQISISEGESLPGVHLLCRAALGMLCL